MAKQSRVQQAEKVVEGFKARASALLAERTQAALRVAEITRTIGAELAGTGSKNDTGKLEAERARLQTRITDLDAALASLGAAWNDAIQDFLAARLQELEGASDELLTQDGGLIRETAQRIEALRLELADAEAHHAEYVALRTELVAQIEETRATAGAAVRVLIAAPGDMLSELDGRPDGNANRAAVAALVEAWGKPIAVAVPGIGHRDAMPSLVGLGWRADNGEVVAHGVLGAEFPNGAAAPRTACWGSASDFRKHCGRLAEGRAC